MTSSQTTYHLAIDGNEANVGQRVGSNVYAYEVLKSLEKLFQTTPEVKVTVLLSHAPQTDLPKMRTGWRYRVVGPRPLWTQFGLPLHLFFHQREYDLFFTPGHYAPRISSVPYISSVMDLAFLHFPEQFKPKDTLQLTNWTAYSVQNAAKVITISEFSKQDIVKQYQFKPENIVVAYPASSSPVKPLLHSRAQALLKKHGISDDFFVYVGTLQPRKNLIRLIEAFEAFCRNSDHKKSKTQLVIAGKIGWLANDIVERIKNSPVSKRIIMTGFVSEQFKALLYERSIATLQVGLYEGFGIPPLEAMQYGSLPIVANTSSLPEVVAEAGLLVDPASYQDIAKAMTKVSSMKHKDKAQFRKKARQQLKKFSWEHTATTIWQTMKQVISETRSHE